MVTVEQKWPSHLVIVRHGESHGNVRKVLAEAGGDHEYGGTVRDMDIELTERGKQQAVATSSYLREHFNFDIAYSSPYRRTLQTTEFLLQAFACRPQVLIDERLREKEFGIFTSLTKAGVRAKFPEESQRKELVGKYYYRPPGGESYPDVNLRVHSFLGTLTRDWRGKSVLVVCHSVIVMSFRRLLERLTEQELLAIDADPEKEVRNSSVTWYTYDSAAGTRGKLVPREFNGIHYSADFASKEPPRTRLMP